MQRRQLLQNLALGAAGAIAFPNVLRAANKKFKWRLVMVVPKSLPIWGEGVQSFAKQVQELTEGGLKIRVYGAGELVPAMQCFDAVRSGSVQMAHSAAYYWQGKIPASVYFTSLPFGMDALGMRSWLLTEGQALWDELYKPYGIFSLPAGNTGVQMGGWFNKEIKTLADFKGLKMRIPGLGGAVLSELGGSPLVVPGGEIYTNLSTGVIDATEWVGPYHDYIMGFAKIASYYYYPGWHEPGSVLELMINQQAWAKLPKPYQEAVKVCAAQLDRDMHAMWLAKDSEYSLKIKSESKVKIKSFPPEVLKGMQATSEKVIQKLAKSSPLAKRIHSSYAAFHKQFQAHQDITQKAFMDI